MMFGMGIVEFLIVVGVVGLIVLILLPGGGSTYDVADETIVQGISWEAADQVLFRELSEVRGLPLVEAHAGTFTLARTSRSVWAYVAAIVLFPVGLVFLLFSHEDRLQVSVSAHPSGCRLRIVGQARRRDIDRVAASIQHVLPVPGVFAR